MFTLVLLLPACGVQLIRDSRGVAELSHAAGEITPGQSGPPAAINQIPVKVQTMAAFERANSAIANRLWPLAAAELRALIDSRPDLSGPCLNLALVYEQQGEPLLAEQFYRQALEVNPENLAAYNQLGIFLREQGRFAEAEQSYLQALSVWEQHPQSHRNIGVLYDLYLGDRQRALHHFTRYQALTDAEDVIVAGWIVDLQHQLPALAQGGQNQ